MLILLMFDREKEWGKNVWDRFFCLLRICITAEGMGRGSCDQYISILKYFNIQCLIKIFRDYSLFFKANVMVKKVINVLFFCEKCKKYKHFLML